jgi:hypothetical protein
MTRTRSARSQLTVNASTTFINVLIERLFINKRTPHRRQHSVRSLNRSAPQAPLVYDNLLTSPLYTTIHLTVDST